MTLPASGAISIGNIMTEAGQAGDNALSWLNGNVKGFSSYSMSTVYGLTWYAKNNAYNCTANAGSQCEPTFVSGVYNCAGVQTNNFPYDFVGGQTNCNVYGACNCACNCDTKGWLQANCNCGANCNCPYNCDYNNCNCVSSDCNCNCACTCFPAGSKVLMADGSTKLIQMVEAGDFVMGADGKPTEVVRLHETILGGTELGLRKMYTFKEDTKHQWSEEHCYWTKRDDEEWWWSVNPTQWQYEVQVGAVAGLKDNNSLRYGFDVQFANLDGWVNRTPVVVNRDPNTPLFLPITKGVPIIINGYVVAASVDEQSYDYTKFSWDKTKINKVEE